MATAIYWKPTGVKTTTIDGSSEVKGHEKKIEAMSLSMGIQGPGGDKPGRISGPRYHSGISMTCANDKATPVLHKVLVTNELLKEVVIEMTDTNKEGVDEVFLTITLTDAAISDINTSYDAQHSGGDMYSITLNYRKIEMLWADGKHTATDDLLEPNVK